MKSVTLANGVAFGLIFLGLVACGRAKSSDPAKADESPVAVATAAPIATATPTSDAAAIAAVGTRAKFVRPVAFDELEAIIFPLEHLPADKERSRRVCEARDSIHSKLVAVDRLLPLGVKVKLWDAITDDLFKELEKVAIYFCPDDLADVDDDTEADASAFIAQYRRLLAVLPGGANSAPVGNVVRPVELDELDHVLSPLITEYEEEARGRAACQVLSQLRSKVLAVVGNVPQGVDVDEWQGEYHLMSREIDATGRYCEERDSRLASAALWDAYRHYRLLIDLLPATEP